MVPYDINGLERVKCKFFTYLKFVWLIFTFFLSAVLNVYSAMDFVSYTKYLVIDLTTKVDIDLKDGGRSKIANFTTTTRFNEFCTYRNMRRIQRLQRQGKIALTT